MKMTESNFDEARNGHVIRFGHRTQNYKFCGKTEHYFSGSANTKRRGGITNVCSALIAGDARGLAMAKGEQS